jgi:NitT/TauT family transport system permease protein
MKKATVRARLGAWALLLALLAGWELASRASGVSTLVLPAPSAVMKSLWRGLSSGYLWPHIRATGLELLLGLSLGCLIGFASGVVLAESALLQRLLKPYIVVSQVVPKLALAPLFIVWFGFGMTSKILMTAVIAFFPILVNTLQGLRLRDRDRQELAIALGASRWQVFRYIRLPGSMPYVFAGLHVSAVFALIGAIVAEFVGARGGIGTMMNEQRALFNVPGVFAILIILMVVGLSVNLLMKALEKRVTFWSREKN